MLPWSVGSGASSMSPEYYNPSFEHNSLGISAPLGYFTALNELNSLSSVFPSERYTLLNEPSPLGFGLLCRNYTPPYEPSPLDLPSSLGLPSQISFSLPPYHSTPLGFSSKDLPELSSKPLSPALPHDFAQRKKFKASHFNASILRIGDWQYASVCDGDLVAKCYFARQRIIWEIFDDRRNKCKIEIRFLNIIALKVSYNDNGLETLDLVLARPPNFFKAIDTEGAKRTIWQTMPDFTGGRATIHRQHCLVCPQGRLKEPFDKLIQSDQRLNNLSQQAQLVHESPYFDDVFPRPFGLREGIAPTFFAMANPTSDFRATPPIRLAHIDLQTGYSFKNSDALVMDACAIEEDGNNGVKDANDFNDLDHIDVPDFDLSTSLDDLVSQVLHDQDGLNLEDIKLIL